MPKRRKLVLEVFFTVMLIAALYSCDFFAPYDLKFLSLSSEELNYDLFENEQQFIITYADSADVNWEITPTIEWISVSPMSGIINIDNPDTITVKIDRFKLLPGNYEDNIEINIDGKTNTLVVKIQMEIKPVLSLSIDSLSFGLSDSLAGFRISNIGNYPLKWDFTPLEEWIEVEPDTGLLAVDSSKFLSKIQIGNFHSINSDTSITVKVDKSKLQTGNHTGILRLKTEAGLDSIKIFVAKSAAPLLKISINSLDFNSEINSKKVSIENLGGETLTWSAAAKDSWVKINPPSGSFVIATKKNNTALETKKHAQTNIKSSEIEISVDREGLPPGQYNSSVEIISNGGKAVIDILMNVPEMPMLSVSPPSLDFGKSEILKHIQVSNSGTGKLVWEASTLETWITIVPRKDSISTGNKDINVSVMRPGLQPGDYSGNVVINSNGGNFTLPVKMSIAEFPQLAFNPASLSFTKTNKESSFEIKNTGEGELSWQLTTAQNWIQVSTQNGTTTTETDVISVSVNTAGLSAGTYNGNIQITSNYGSGIIQVSLVITETPKLTYSPATLNFGDNQLSKTFEIKNEGDGNLNWQLSTNESWVIISSLNGSASANQKDEIEVQINKNGLAPGNYSGNINITSNGGNGNVQISMTVKENPELSLSTSELSFGDTDSLKTFKIKNTGDGNLEWQLSPNESWIILSTSAGTLGVNQEKEIEVKVNRKSLTPGNYSGNIAVLSNGGNGTIDITMTIKENPKLAVSSELLDFGDKDSSKTFEIKNEGDGNLNWQLSTNKSWIILSKTGGSAGANQKDEIGVKINRTNLAPGNYSGSISVTSNGGDKTINVSMKVAEKPGLSVSTGILDFGSSQSSLSFIISNKGTGTLNWKIEEGYESWISASPKSGSVTTGEKNVNVDINRDLLSPGTYSSLIKITSNGGNESIEVKVEILEEPVLSVSKSSIDFGSLGENDNFIIQNTGTGELTWSSEIMYISGDNGWVQMIPGNGNTSSYQTITVNANRQMLSAGVHTADIQIYSNGGNSTIHLYITVDAASYMEISTYQLRFDSINEEKTFEIINSGGGVLTYSIDTDNYYNIVIKPDPESGSVTAGSKTVSVSLQTGIATEINKPNKVEHYTIGKIRVHGGDNTTKTIEVKLSYYAH